MTNNASARSTAGDEHGQYVFSTAGSGTLSWRWVAAGHIAFSTAVFVACIAFVRTGMPSTLVSLTMPSYPHAEFSMICAGKNQMTTIASDGKGKVSISDNTRHVVGDFLKGKTWIVYKSDPRYGYEYDCLLPEIQQASLRQTAHTVLCRKAPSADNFVVAHRSTIVRL